MQLKCISTGSHGNGFVLTTDDKQSLIIEAGVKLSRIKKYLNFDLSNVVGVVVSHAHL